MTKREKLPPMLTLQQWQHIRQESPLAWEKFTAWFAQKHPGISTARPGWVQHITIWDVCHCFWAVLVFSPEGPSHYQVIKAPFAQEEKKLAAKSNKK